MRRRDLLRAGLVLGMTSLAGCTTRYGGDPVPATTTSVPSESSAASEPLPEVLNLGVAEYRPYAYQDDGVLTGEVVEIAKAVCERLGLRLKVTINPYDALEPKLRAGGFDAVGALRLAPKNCAWLDRFVADHVSNSALAVPAGNPLGLAGFTEVVAKGARLGTVLNAFEIQGAQAAGVTNLTTFPNAEVALSALADGRVDCVAYDDITLHDMIASRTGLEVLNSFEPPGAPIIYGYGFGPGRDALATAFLGGLRGLRDGGDWFRIANPFGFGTSNVLPPSEADKTCE